MTKYKPHPPRELQGQPSVRRMTYQERREMCYLAFAKDQFDINVEMMRRYSTRAGFANPTSGVDGRVLDVIRPITRHLRPLPTVAPADTPLARSAEAQYARLLKMPHSEVCMHMGVAGRWMWVTPVYGRGSRAKHPSMAQLWTTNGTKFSMPITTGEAGWHGRDVNNRVPCNICGVGSVDPDAKKHGTMDPFVACDNCSDEWERRYGNG